jgi:hypothetical protein
MGYNTQFKGELKFDCEMTAPMLAKLHQYFGEDTREHPELELSRQDGGYIDLKMTKDFSGIQWDDGTEKTYNLDKIVDALIQIMRKEYPSFALKGVMLAQGEDIEDRWELFIDADGHARKRDVAIPGVKIHCPRCRHAFMYEGETSV